MTRDIKLLASMGPSRVVLLEALEQMVITFENLIGLMPVAIADDAAEVILRNRALIAHYRSDVGSWKQLDRLLNAIDRTWRDVYPDDARPELARILRAYSAFCGKGAGMKL